ncbi:MAG: pseudouridine synthase [Candidatus Paceibacterota bacterium]|jgi:23S rRNA pseudouridine2604 synthase|nr:rRNA pseudouridine synthase [Candidatus Paceibacterota bacterium]
MTQENEYPVRINKYLAARGETTRRGADILIEDKKVTINGRLAKLGDLVNEGDTVTVRGADKKEYLYYAYYKPRGMITHSPQNDEESIEDAIRGKIRGEVFPIGRLDKDSHGLIILTNDGRITEKLLSPERKHEKEYMVTVDKPVTARFIKDMERGVDIEGYRTKPARAKEAGNCKINIVITEGKKHQLRRMCAALGYTVKDIKRIRIMNITLGALNPRASRQLKGKELSEFLTLLS